jgi:hypothetical protein
VSALDLKYDVGADRLRARLRPSEAGDIVRVRQGKVVVDIDRTRKRVVAFEVVDFRHFVSYRLLAQLFGDGVVQKIAAFQSAAVTSSKQEDEIQFTTLPGSSRRVVEQLLKAA